MDGLSYKVKYSPSANSAETEFIWEKGKTPRTDKESGVSILLIKCSKIAWKYHGNYYEYYGNCMETIMKPVWKQL